MKIAVPHAIRSNGNGIRALRVVLEKARDEFDSIGAQIPFKPCPSGMARTVKGFTVQRRARPAKNEHFFSPLPFSLHNKRTAATGGERKKQKKGKNMEFYLVKGLEILKYVAICVALIACLIFAIWYAFVYYAPLEYPWEKEDRRRELEERRKNEKGK